MTLAWKPALLAVAVILSLTALTAAGVANGSMAAGATTLASPAAPTGGGGCPASNAIGNFVSSSLVGTHVAKTNTTWTYYFDSFQNLSPVNGVPGLLTYCIYAGSTAPTTLTVSAVGDNGAAWTTLSKTTQGYIGFERPNGNPSNIGLNGAMNVLMGSANWSGGAPSPQTILLHINDAAECQGLYGGWATTCFVYPASPCDGNPACKTASIAEATSTNPLTVPAKTQLHITWTFSISNALSNNFSMEFPFSTFPMATGNGTGLRDFFNCGETPDSSGSPGALGSFANYQGIGFTLTINTTNMPCSMERVVLTNPGGTIVLMPGQSITFTINMVDPGFLVRGLHCLNHGINLRWVQSDDGLIHAYHAPDVDVLVA